MSNKLKTKIIFVQYHPNTIKTEKDYYLDVLFANNFELEYWDLTELFFPGLVIADTIKRGYERYFTTYGEIESAIKQLDIQNTFFIIQITYNRNVIKLFRLFTKYNCWISIFYIGAFPVGESKLKNKVKNNLGFKVFGKILDRLLPKIYKKLKLVKDYDTVFTSGKVAIDLFKNNSNIVPINLFDYDNYVLVKDNKNKILDRNYCVYIDDNWAFHPDVEMLNLPVLNAEKHFLELNDFFNKIEAKFDIEVVIAAHPKSNYTNEFGNRKILKYKTNELIKDCQFVITSISTAVSYAILFHKPILFIYTSEIEGKYKFTMMNDIIKNAELLGSQLINIANIKSYDIEIKEINKVKYNVFKYNYLTSKESENKLSQEIVLKYFTSPV